MVYILRVNMSDLSIKKETVPEKYQLMGGRALTSHIINAEVDPHSHALGPNNKLVFAPGLLAGTPAPSSGRLSVGTKSPLTGTIKESNAGGVAAQKLARLGVKAIIVEGQPKDDKWYILKIDNEGGQLLPADKIIGKGNYETGELLRAQFGEKAGVISIGPAGENKMSAASIAVADMEGHPVRHAGRGGTGAVMGSKGLKALVIDDTNAPGVEIKDKEAFRGAAQAFSKMLLANPTCGTGLPTYGTAVLINILNEAGGLPTENFKRGRFEGAEKISGEFMYDTILARKGNPTHACHPGCVMRCSQIYNDAEGNYLTAGFEYETIWAFGADCCIDNLDQIAMADRLCDDLGLDTIEMGVTMAVAMEAGVIPFGDGEGMLNLLKNEIGKATPLGRILGQGAAFTGQAYGITRVPVVKKQGIPAYDPRAVKGIGVTYATTTMGADHTAGYSVATNILKVGGFVNPLGTEGQVDLSRGLQIATAAIDSSGLCLFVAFTVLDEPEALPKVADMLTAQYGVKVTVDDITELGKAVLRVEREFNTRAGFTPAHDRLPEFFANEPVPPHNTTFDIAGEELDKVFNF
ncbi:aldehyde ferredoxin oxidoreductase [Thermanaerosceptrum fracticalcis]|uniref:Aldehyde ferredoxin oxidoreductase n=1 Tax=Thermanaerosceptrum fracticalcis TaxID=1712410 RepID=A0A7G6E8C4_THEFR|nr:aldehyde ferredoxin oxidoreductase [Thermanaerosceptrum fracticalcis]